MSDLPGTLTLYWYLDGYLSEATTRTWKTIQVSPGEHVSLEVLDTADPPQSVYPGRMMLQWEAVNAAGQYRIEEYVSGVWTTRRTVLSSYDEVMRHMTRYLEDETTHQFRVVPVGTNANDGTEKNFSALMVRRPDVADLVGTYSAVTGRLTWAAA